MTRNRWIALGVVGALALVAFGGWFVFFRDDAPERVSLEGALATETTVAGADEPATTVATAGTAGIDGTWVVDPSAESFVGYRVQEELATIGATTAVGRTGDVEGSLVIAGADVTALDVVADLTTLRSDSSQRDGQLRSRGLETDDFPAATFTLTAPIELGTVPEVGEPISATAQGQMTLHGVTRDVEVVVEAQRTADQILVIGSLPIFLPDYDIVAPTGLRVLTIDDDAEMEFQFFFVLP